MAPKDTKKPAADKKKAPAAPAKTAASTSKAAPAAAKKPAAKPVKKVAPVKKTTATKVPVTVATKARKAQSNVAKGVHQKRAIKVRYQPRFLRQKVRMLPRSPKCPVRLVPNRNKVDKYSIIRYPLTTESAMKKIEDDNTLVFIVDEKANKTMIKVAVRKLYDIKAIKVNTLNRPDGLKKAYVRLAREYDSLDVANKIGII
jgi:large subunit ribosomal protein L23Ae